MGCCASSATTDGDNEDLSGKNKTAPIPTIVEEETVVKEVLSEFTSAKDPVTTKIQECEEKKSGLKLVPSSELTRPDPEEGSEISEICSLSVSESVSTSTAVNGYDEEEMKQRRSQGMRQSSPAKSRTRVTGNYPTRMSDQSPRKRITSTGGGGGGSVRVVQPRSGSGMKDPGERSGRRSRSPAMNRSVMDPNQNRVCGARRKNNNQSPGRVRLDPNKNRSDQQRSENYGYTTEDPLVSLECFIFL